MTKSPVAKYFNGLVFDQRFIMMILMVIFLMMPL